MLVLLKKTYEISVTVQEGNDEFWDGLKGRSGCDEVVEAVRIALADHGLREPQVDVRLIKFDERGPL